MSRLTFFLCALLLSLPAFPDTILVLGDSISAGYGIPSEKGWVNLLQQRLNGQYPGRYQVINASISGDTSAQGLARLPGLLDTHNPDQVVVELGGNDGLRGLPLSHMKDNLQAIIDLARERGADVVLVSVSLPASYGTRFNQLFEEVFASLAAVNGLPRVNLGFSLLNDRNLLQEDGIHPTQAAQPLLVDAVLPALIGDEST
ncbi:MAG: arylesterase [Porticoccaceae bacterium]|nr:arylesterase [Porticoccaceae bacterium]